MYEFIFHWENQFTFYYGKVLLIPFKKYIFRIKIAIEFL